MAVIALLIFTLIRDWGGRTLKSRFASADDHDHLKSRVAVMEEKIRHSPTHEDLKTLRESIASVNVCVGDVRMKLANMDGRMQLIMAMLAKDGRQNDLLLEVEWERKKYE